MKELVIKISNIFKREKVKFILIGALARDIFFEEKNIDLDVKTKDIDFAVLVEDWDEFHKVKKNLIDELKMREVKEIEYRLMYGEVPVDLLPFGQIAEPNATVNWPGQFRMRMKVQGFQEAYDTAQEISLGGASVRIVIPEMLLAMKISSWSHGDRIKDAVDIRLILENLKVLCPDLLDDTYKDKNEGLAEKFDKDENGLRIALLGSRIQSLISGSGLSTYLKTTINTDFNFNKLVIDMNEGNVPDKDTDKKLKSLLTPLKDGLSRS